MKTKILVVEDDRALSLFMRKVLEDHDIQPDCVSDADKALEYLKSFRPDVLILDVNLPGLSGMQLCELLRKDSRTSDIPILMLSVLKGVEVKVKGLHAGADDYLVKPFEPKELIARIQAILRRTRRQEGLGPILERHGISVDLERHQVKVEGRAVELRPKEYDLLVTFLRRPGRVLSWQVLSETVWGLDSIVTRHTLNEHIKNLRQKLGRQGKFIETIQEAGYRLKEER